MIGVQVADIKEAGQWEQEGACSNNYLRLLNLPMLRAGAGLNPSLPHQWGPPRLLYRKNPEACALMAVLYKEAYPNEAAASLKYNELITENPDSGLARILKARFLEGENFIAAVAEGVSTFGSITYIMTTAPFNAGPFARFREIVRLLIADNLTSVQENAHRAIAEHAPALVPGNGGIILATALDALVRLQTEPSSGSQHRDKRHAAEFQTPPETAAAAEQAASSANLFLPNADWSSSYNESDGVPDFAKKYDYASNVNKCRNVADFYAEYLQASGKLERYYGDGVEYMTGRSIPRGRGWRGKHVHVHGAYITDVWSTYRCLRDALIRDSMVQELQDKISS
jgi:hypothetical protein